MKTALKLGLLCFLLLGLVSCGDGEEEITYDPSPIDLPKEYILTDSDSAPAFYTDVMTYVEESVIQPESDEDETDLSGLELTKEQEKLIQEEADRKQAAWEAELAEITKVNNKLMSIRLVSVYDPSEANAELLAIEQEIRDEIAAEEAKLEAEKKVAELENGGTSTEGVTEAPLSAETESTTEELPHILSVVPQESFIYTYDTSTTGKTGGQATSEYVTYMQKNGFKIIDAFHPVNEEYYEMVTPDFTQRAGTVALARGLSVPGRIFLLVIDWNQNGAVVTVSSESGTIWIAPKTSTASKGALSIEDAVTYLSTRNPSELGLSGTSMNDYSIYTSEALMIINGTTYRQFNISETAHDGTGNSFAGSYLIEADGNVYSLDVLSGTIYPLNATNVYDTLS